MIDDLGFEEEVEPNNAIQDELMVEEGAEADQDMAVADWGNANNVVDVSNFSVDAVVDLESILQQYKGIQVYKRMKFIANHCPSLKIDALQALMRYLKRETLMSNQYSEVHNLLAEALSPAKPGAIDQEWLNMIKTETTCRIDKLDTDLKNYKANWCCTAVGTG